MEVRKIRRLLRKYIAGSVKQEEKLLVDRWYNSFDNEGTAMLPDLKAAQVRQEIWDRIEPVLSEEKSSRSFLFKMPWLKVAALVIIILSYTGWLLLKRYHAGRSPYRPFTEISTATGERKSVRLKDGSVLVLNTASVVRIGNDFPDKRRVEILDGEVCFYVSKDTCNPFIIKSGPLTTQVLGTTFNITAYKELSTLKVGVLSGRVKVSSSGTAFGILEKEQQLVYDRLNKSHRIGKTGEDLFAWQEGRLLLDDISFDDMTILMKKNFGIEVVAGSGWIRQTRYTTVLSASVKPLEAVEILAAIHNLKINVKERRFVLYR